MNNVEIGERIKHYRQAKKITQKQLASMIGKTESSIRKYEKGLVEIPISVIENIAFSLDIPVKKIYITDEKNNIQLIGNFDLIEALIESCEFISDVGYGFDEVGNGKTSGFVSIVINDTEGNEREFTVDELIQIQSTIKSYFKALIENRFGFLI
jgi:transcriptional regulator with XRE-family HTH domain